MAALIAAAPAGAQEGLPLPRPGDERPELPGFEPEERQPRSVLPPLQLPEDPDLGGLAAGHKVYVHSYRIVGGRFLSTEELREITAPYSKREVSFAELSELRDRLTLAALERGYLTSGAVIPDQTIGEDGILTIEIVEGTLADVQVHSEGRLRDGYFTSRIELLDEPLNVNDLEERLQIFQKDRRIEQVQAQLVPGEERGESVLSLTVVEAPPLRLQAGADNYHSPSVGAEGGRVWGGFDNALGWGDATEVSYARTRSLWDLSGRFEVPITPGDTLLGVSARAARSEVIERPFDELDIESHSETYRVWLRQPVYRSPSHDLSLSVAGEWRRSQTFLLGEGFAFTEGPDSDGVSRVSVVRLGQAWAYSDRTRAAAVRSQLSFGLEILNATENDGVDVPDGKFFSWLGQVQVAQLLPWWGLQLVGRFDVQLSDSPLLSLEQFSLGGARTVRGYRENTLVRDNAWVGSAELRVPLLDLPDWDVRLELAPFADVGRAWNDRRPNRGPQRLASAGVGGRLFLPYAFAELYWGQELEDVDTVSGSHDLQDDGIHFSVTVAWP